LSESAENFASVNASGFVESPFGEALVKTSRYEFRLACLNSALISACLICGCGDSGPSTTAVTGEVVYPTGASLPLGGRVIFASPGDSAHTAKGHFGSDGKFQLTTTTDGDGAVPGEYLVAVLPTLPDDRGSMSERAYAQALEPIDKKYLDPQTSGLRYTVLAEKGPQHFRIEVTKPRGRR
jgi:hypothetical protein